MSAAIERPKGAAQRQRQRHADAAPAQRDSCAAFTAAEPPRLGFVGLGWIGAQRMQALADSKGGRVAAICDADPSKAAAARAALGSNPALCETFEQLLEQPLDGVVIATPNLNHEQQAVDAMQRGLAVFCQKPLAMSAAGTRRVVELARRTDLPLGVDWSYRYLAGVPELRAALESGEIGEVTAAEMCFHNAYGPDAAWYYDVASSGGGCLLDLGCHLLDLCHWLLGATEPVRVSARCYRQGAPLAQPVAAAEDLVMAEVAYASGLDVHLACSWRASAGRGAVIECRVLGTDGGAAIRNVGGSFYDFEVEINHGADAKCLGAPPDPWPGRALTDWARQVALGVGCGSGLEHLVTTASVIDRIYGRGAGECAAGDSCRTMKVSGRT